MCRYTWEAVVARKTGGLDMGIRVRDGRAAVEGLSAPILKSVVGKLVIVMLRS